MTSKGGTCSSSNNNNSSSSSNSNIKSCMVGFLRGCSTNNSRPRSTATWHSCNNSNNNSSKDGYTSSNNNCAVRSLPLPAKLLHRPSLFQRPDPTTTCDT